VTTETTIYPKWQTSLKRHRSSARRFIELQGFNSRDELAIYVETGSLPKAIPPAEVVPPYEGWERQGLYLSSINVSDCFYATHYLNVISGKDGHISDVGNSFLYGYLAYLVHTHVIYQGPKRFGRLQSSSWLAWWIPQITFGYLVNEGSRADRMAKLAIKNFHTGRMPYREYPIFTFMLAVLADYLGEEPVEFIGKAAEATALQQLVGKWREHDPMNIRELCIAACDIHTQRCRKNSVKELFEFNNLFFYEWPIAINLLFKLREKLGADSSNNCNLITPQVTPLAAL
jgi:hypothetical protein